MNNIVFNRVTGVDIRNLIGNTYLEKDVENAIHISCRHACQSCDITKMKMGLGINDGTLRLYDENHNLYRWYIIECKKDMKTIGKPFQFLQAMIYACGRLFDIVPDDLIGDKFGGVILVDADMLVLTARKDIDLDDLEKVYNKTKHIIKPCKAYENNDCAYWAESTYLRSFISRFDSNFRLDEFIKLLYTIPFTK